MITDAMQKNVGENAYKAMYTMPTLREQGWKYMCDKRTQDVHVCSVFLVCRMNQYALFMLSHSTQIAAAELTKIVGAITQLNCPFGPSLKADNCRCGIYMKFQDQIMFFKVKSSKFLVFLVEWEP